MDFAIKRFMFLLLVLTSVNTSSAENLFYANYAEIDKAVWSYLAKNHPDIDSKDLKVSAYSFEKVVGDTADELINVVLNYKIENPVIKKKVRMHGKATYRGSLANEEGNSRTMTLLINPAGQVVKEIAGKVLSEK